MTEPDAGLLDAAVHYAGFECMQALERSDYFSTDILRAGSIEDKENYKVRRGHIGGFREYLIDDDFAYVDGVIADFRRSFIY